MIYGRAWESKCGYDGGGSSRGEEDVGDASGIGVEVIPVKSDAEVLDEGASPGSSFEGVGDGVFCVVSSLVGGGGSEVGYCEIDSPDILWIQ